MLSVACMFIYSSHGKWVFPLLLWSFPPNTNFISFPTPDCWVCAAAPAFSHWPVYLQLTWEGGLPPSPVEFFFPPPLLQAFKLLVAGCVPLLLPSPAGLLWGISPLPLFSAQGTPPSLLCDFFVLIAYYSVCVFFLFSLGGGQSVQGDMLIWPRVVYGSITCHLAHLVVHVFPSRLGAAVSEYSNLKLAKDTMGRGPESSEEF
jgi:hypothetical protein